VPPADAAGAAATLGGKVIGEVTERTDVVEIAGLEGRRGAGFAPASSSL